MPDQDHRVPASGVPASLGVHLRHQRTGRVDHIEPPSIRLRPYRRRDTVGGEDHSGAVRYRVEFIDEDRAATLQVRDHVGVVHDLLAHVDGSSSLPQQLLDDLDRPLHPRAK